MIDIDPTLLPIIRSLASQSEAAKEIADRLGVFSNSLKSTSEEGGEVSAPSSGTGEEFVNPFRVLAPGGATRDNLIESLMVKIKQMNETILMLKIALEDNSKGWDDNIVPLSPDQERQVEEMLTLAFQSQPSSMIRSFYDKEYFSSCHPTLHQPLARTLVDEFTRRDTTPQQLWLDILN